MSYEQKYLKYKQKYQELKKHINVSNVHKMQTEVDIQDFILTDTPTMDNMTGGGDADVNMEETVDFNLTDTPTEQVGGMVSLTPATFGPTVPLTTCPGQVNPMPDVSMGLSGTLSGLAANPSGPVLPAPVPQVAGGENYLISAEEVELQLGGGDSEAMGEELNTTTDVSEIQNTEDIERLFDQFGGKRGRPRKVDTETASATTEQSARSGKSTQSRSSKTRSHSHKNSSSSSSGSSSSSASLSDFDDSLTVSDF